MEQLPNLNKLFEPTTVNLGRVETWTQAKAVFKRDPGGLLVKNIDVACGCTEYTATDTEIVVTYFAGALPEGVVENKKTEYPVKKRLTIKFFDDTFQDIWIDAVVFVNA